MPGDLETKVSAGVSVIVKRICTGCNLPFWQQLIPGFRKEQCTDCVWKARAAKARRDKPVRRGSVS